MLNLKSMRNSVSKKAAAVKEASSKYAKKSWSTVKEIKKTESTADDILLGAGSAAIAATVAGLVATSVATVAAVTVTAGVVGYSAPRVKRYWDTAKAERRAEQALLTPTFGYEVPEDVIDVTVDDVIDPTEVLDVDIENNPIIIDIQAELDVVLD